MIKEVNSKSTETLIGIQLSRFSGVWCEDDKTPVDGKADPPRLLCEPGDIPPPSRVDTSARVTQLRQLMQATNVSAYIVLTNDDHQVNFDIKYLLKIS